MSTGKGFCMTLGEILCFPCIVCVWYMSETEKKSQSQNLLKEQPKDGEENSSPILNYGTAIETPCIVEHVGIEEARLNTAFAVVSSPKHDRTSMLWDYSDVFVQQESKLETDVISQAKDNSSKKLNIRNETILEEQNEDVFSEIEKFEQQKQIIVKEAPKINLATSSAEGSNNAITLTDKNPQQDNSTSNISTSAFVRPSYREIESSEYDKTVKKKELNRINDFINFERN